MYGHELNLLARAHDFGFASQFAINVRCGPIFADAAFDSNGFYVKNQLITRNDLAFKPRFVYAHEKI
jgi:hypothetical protein